MLVLPNFIKRQSPGVLNASFYISSTRTYSHAPTSRSGTVHAWAVDVSSRVAMSRLRRPDGEISTAFASGISVQTDAACAHSSSNGCIVLRSQVGPMQSSLPPLPPTPVTARTHTRLATTSRPHMTW